MTLDELRENVNFERGPGQRAVLLQMRTSGYEASMTMQKCGFMLRSHACTRTRVKRSTKLRLLIIWLTVFRCFFYYETGQHVSTLEKLQFGTLKFHFSGRSSVEGYAALTNEYCAGLTENRQRRPKQLGENLVKLHAE